MISTDAFRTVVGIIGNVVSFGLFLSPIPTFYSIYEKGAVEDFSHNPYLVTILNCALWVYYGIVHPDSLLVITINGVGLVIEFIYVALYIIYASKNQRVSVAKKSLPGTIFYVLVVFLLTLIPNPKSWRGITIGVLCDAVNMAMYAMPFDMLYTVYETKSLEYMPFCLSLFGFLNSGCWLTYALLRFDPYILASNIVGCVFGIIQLSVYAYYYFYYPQSKKSNNNKIDGDKVDGRIV